MRIQYISDIHLEFLSSLLKAKRFSPKADILCLAGDIGYPASPIYRQFLKSVSTDFKKVFLIAGNHEYYDPKGSQYTAGSSAADVYYRAQSMDAVHETIKGVIADLPNITFLDNSYEDYEGVRFVGTTLWTRIPAAPVVLINDFHEIPEMTPALYNELHLGACEFLESADVQESPLPVVVITHHVPSPDFTHPAYVKYAAYNCFFAADCERFFKPPLITWIYGHTHMPARTIREGIQFACNPVGYPAEATNRHDLNAVLELA